MSETKHNRRLWLRIPVAVIGGLLLLIVAGLTFISLWLTPSRLTSIVNSRASEYLQADVRFYNLQFTIWSSFPRFHIQADSCVVYSRTLDSIPENLRKTLPEDYRRLFSSGKFIGGVNLQALALGKIKLHDVEVSRVNLNLVAVSDSLDNWSIFPTNPDSHSHIPAIEANVIAFPDPENISYRSLQSGLNLQMNPKTARMKEVKHHKNTYDCKFDGLISAAVQDMQLLSDFPFNLNGDIALDFNPFKIKFSDFGIGLGNIRGHVSLDLLASDDAKINAFSCNFDSFRVLTLLNYLPTSVIPDLTRLPQAIEMNLSARLTRPYRMTSGSLPSLELDVRIPEGDLEYQLGTEPLSIWHSTFEARLNFDGEDINKTSLYIEPFRTQAEGTAIDIRADVSNLMEQPQVDSEIAFDGTFKCIARLFPDFGKLNPEGKTNGKVNVSFSFPAYNNPTPRNINLTADIKVPEYTMDTEPGRSRLDVSGLNLALSSAGNMDNGNFIFDKPISFSLEVGSADWHKGHTNLSAKSLNLKGDGVLTGEGDVLRSLTAHLNNKYFAITSPGHSLDFKGIDADLSLRPSTVAERRVRFAPRPHFKDSLWLSKTPHLPAALTVHSPGFAKFVTNWRLPVDLKLNSAEWDIEGYPYPFKLANTDLSCDFDSLDIRTLPFSSGVSRVSVSGKAAGFRNLLAGAPFAPLTGHLDLQGPMIDINQIAKATHGEKKRKDTSSKETDKKEGPAEDAWILPRNLNVALDLNLGHALYTNLDLTDLRSRIILKDGYLDIPDLSMDMGFAGLKLSALYNTNNLEDLTMKAALEVTDLDLQPMYAKFKSMVSDFPQIKNLSGFAGLSAKVNFGISPDMSVDMASLSAGMTLTGRQLTLKQDPFIRRVTKMLLVRSDKPISIKDIDICATVHDNLLELYPFWLDFENYRLYLTGVNNFAGDLDYHIGVLHSPIPLHFGINVEGMYHHPKIRFGGPSWKPDDARRVTSDISKSFLWNFAKKMRWAGNELMTKAASGQTL